MSVLFLGQLATVSPLRSARVDVPPLSPEYARDGELHRLLDSALRKLLSRSRNHTRAFNLINISHINAWSEGKLLGCDSSLAGTSARLRPA